MKFLYQVWDGETGESDFVGTFSNKQKAIRCAKSSGERYVQRIPDGECDVADIIYGEDPQGFLFQPGNGIEPPED